MFQINEVVNNRSISLRLFLKWATKTGENKRLVLSSAVTVIILFTWFKLLYPYPNFLPDSYAYLEAAHLNREINTWPIGYSKFLRLFSALTHSDTALVFCQYLMLQASIICFLLTLGYLLQPGKLVMRVMFAGLVLNPLWLYLSNFVSSDALFTALSVCWFTTLIWILLHSNSLRLYFMHALILVLVFMVRYNALYYPVISALAILSVKANLRYKIAGIGMIGVLLGTFIIHTENSYQQLTGKRQFSAFGGWQLASNALFMYSRIDHYKEIPVPEEFKDLHNITLRHMDSVRALRYRPDAVLGIYYLWDDKSPLKQYMNTVQDTIKNPFIKWAHLGPLYMRYGKWLIQQHPNSFVQHYLAPNFMNYYVPGAEFLSVENMGTDTVELIAKQWFGYKTNKVRSYAQNKKIQITMASSISLSAINILFLVACIGFVIMNGLGNVSIAFKRILFLTVLIWISNLAFSVLASPVVLRYQAFPMIITFSLCVLLTVYIIQRSFSDHKISGAQLNNESKPILPQTV